MLTKVGLLLTAELRLSHPLLCIVHAVMESHYSIRSGTRTPGPQFVYQDRWKLTRQRFLASAGIDHSK